MEEDGRSILERFVVGVGLPTGKGNIVLTPFRKRLENFFVYLLRVGVGDITEALSVPSECCESTPMYENAVLTEVVGVEGVNT